MTKESKKPPYVGTHRKDQPHQPMPTQRPISGKVPKGSGKS